jgi:hypothetical protein
MTDERLRIRTVAHVGSKDADRSQIKRVEYLLGGVCWRSHQNRLAEGSRYLDAAIEIVTVERTMFGIEAERVERAAS